MFERKGSHSNSPEPLKAFLAGIRRQGETVDIAQEHLEELHFLCDTMGLEIVGEEMTSVGKPSIHLLLGSGQVERICEAAAMREADLIVIDDELSPAQQRNWEKKSELAVIDRREVILDIFAQRARTREARLQVELARLQYSLPRLKRAWTHLERQRGGAGFIGGAGEAQIELDRRMVRDDIAKCKRELASVRRHRETQRKARHRKPVPTAAIVGYTNAGKSSLLNTLTGADVLAEDKLFATLDPTTRRMDLPNHQELVLTDTVGFIRKLPHQLVEAFKSTLEEAKMADLIIHVVDMSHPDALQHLEASIVVLEELGAMENETIYVLNKVDCVEDLSQTIELRERAQPHLMVSAKTGKGLEELIDYLCNFTAKQLQHMHLRIPPNRYDIVGLLHREANIIETKYDMAEMLAEVEIPTKFAVKLTEFIEEPTLIDQSPEEVEKGING